MPIGWERSASGVSFIKGWNPLRPRSRWHGSGAGGRDNGAGSVKITAISLIRNVKSYILLCAVAATYIGKDIALTCLRHKLDLAALARIAFAVRQEQTDRPAVPGETESSRQLSSCAKTAKKASGAFALEQGPATA